MEPNKVMLAYIRSWFSKKIDLWKPQPLPKSSKHPPVWPMVIKDMEDSLGNEPLTKSIVRDMKARDKLGEAKYNTRLKSFNGRDSLQDAYEELLDAAVYLRQYQYEQKDWRAGVSYRQVILALLDLKDEIDRRDNGSNKEATASITSSTGKDQVPRTSNT